MFKSFMALALQEAVKAYHADEVPVGCVIVKDNHVIALSSNLMKRTMKQINHAEMIAIDSASTKLSSGYLNECDMYVTLEPCTMCAAAISLTRIRRLYCGALDPKGGGIYHNGKLFYNTKGLFHIPEHYSGFMAEKSETLLRSFFKLKRNGA